MTKHHIFLSRIISIFMFGVLTTPVYSNIINEREKNDEKSPQNLGTLSSQFNIKGIVHSSRDSSDHFKFKLNRIEAVTVRLRPDAGAALYVYTDNGNCKIDAADSVRLSNNSGKKTETITIKNARSGCYFANVLSGSYEFTDYKLDIFKGATTPPTKPKPTPPKDPKCPPKSPGCQPK